MIAAVGPGIVFLHVNSWMTNGSDRAPVKTAEVYDQIRSNISYVFIQLAWLEYKGVQWLTFVVG